LISVGLSKILDKAFFLIRITYMEGLSDLLVSNMQSNSYFQPRILIKKFAKFEA